MLRPLRSDHLRLLSIVPEGAVQRLSKSKRVQHQQHNAMKTEGEKLLAQRPPEAMDSVHAPSTPELRRTSKSGEKALRRTTMEQRRERESFVPQGRTFQQAAWRGRAAYGVPGRKEYTLKPG